jgi:NAD(P)H dehydrogenase (quinone)
VRAWRGAEFGDRVIDGRRAQLPQREVVATERNVADVYQREADSHASGSHFPALVRVYRQTVIYLTIGREMPAIAVTGATGKLGGRVARRLEDAGIAQCLLVRDAARAPDLAGAEVLVAGYADTEAVRAALYGLTTVFMVSAAEAPDRVEQQRNFVDAAIAAGVEHLVYVSFVGASARATFTLARDHWATEEHIKDTGIAYTFLRDNVYSDVLPHLVGTDGVLRGPAGQGRIAPVTQDDIADVAVMVLTDSKFHAGKTYNLTGPETLTLARVADVLSDVTGRSVRYEPETLEDAYETRREAATSQWQLDAWVSTYTAIAAGELDGVSNDIEELTGRPATSFEDLLRSG